MSPLVRPIVTLTLTAMGTLLVALACGRAETDQPLDCDAELPDGWACTTSLEVEQSACQGSTLDQSSETTVTAAADGQGVMISGGHFRCEQEVCAYLDADAARLLVQPCDMAPNTYARCDCLYGLQVDVVVPAEGLDVYTRFDSVGGEQEPRLLGHVPAANEDVAPQRLCDGSSRLRFATQRAGGNLTGVPRVAAEIGWGFLLVDGQCRYWIATYPDREVRTGVLSEAEEAEFSDALLLGHWSELESANVGCPDAGSSGFRFYDERFSISCASNELTDGANDWYARLYDVGQPLDGPVRYTLADATEAWPVGIEEFAQSWPLAWDPATQAVGSTEDEGDLAEPLVANGEEAAALRSLRSSYEANGPADGLGPWLRIPVVYEMAETEPRYFDLALRDVTPFEIDGRLDIDASFE